MPIVDNRVPSLIIVGVQKCGTSALYKALCKHSQIAGAAYRLEGSARFAPKELQFFGTNSRAHLGLEWYLRHFDDSPTRKIEASPCYIAKRASIEHLRHEMPGVKVLLILRDPLDRAMSAWYHWQRLDGGGRWPIPSDGGDFEENIRLELNASKRGKDQNGFFRRGLYHESVRLLRQHFNCDQVRIVFLEEFIRDPGNELASLQDWLGVRREELSFEKANVGKNTGAKFAPGVLMSLWKVYNASNLLLEKDLGRRHPWARTWREWGQTREGKLDLEDTRADAEFADACKQFRHRIFLEKLRQKQFKVKNPGHIAKIWMASDRRE